MPQIDNNFVMQRTLNFVVNGRQTVGKMTIGDFQGDESKRKWACQWSIPPIHPEIGRLYGDDPLDAMIKTLDFLSSLIRGSERDGLRIWWLTEEDHAGFTFPASEERHWEKMPPQ